MAPSGVYTWVRRGLFVAIMAASLTVSYWGIYASSFADDTGCPPVTGQLSISINPAKFSNNFDDRIINLINAVDNQENARVPGAKRINNAQINSNSPITIKEDLYNKILSLQS